MFCENIIALTWRSSMFTKILIANRGEIARRITRTAKKMGITVVAIYSEADEASLHVQEADEAYCVGGPKVADSYLQMDRIIKVALDAGCQAVHPGYGLLSENPVFAEKCKISGLTFIGPDAVVIEQMGSKLASRQAMEEIGVPVVPGITLPLASGEAAIEAAHQIGYPIMLKAAFGGGGIGMQVVQTDDELMKAFESNQKRAESFFGNGTLFLEKKIENARHIEVQVLADSQGNTVYLWDRECSVQRRHQKILEEAPAPRLSQSTKEAMGKAAVRATAHLGYENAGTLEFLVDESEGFYFLEMNTRLQVEHPVTEEITGLDLVEWQLRIASGEPFPYTQEQIKQEGHAIEVRIYAEDPNTFYPSPGTLTRFEVPKLQGIRHEIGVSERSVVSPYYDPMIAKLIASAPTRGEAIELLQKALESYVVEGIKTNIPMLHKILASEHFLTSYTTTQFVEMYLKPSKK
jgi:acetyl-CoA carboxylase, biotin carboxylase subunit